MRGEVIHMAMVEQVSSQLRLVFHDGEDVSTGKPIYKAKSFNNVKTTATAEALFEVANALSELQERSLYTIERRDYSEIVED